jgi:hypothetical protein
MRRSGELNPPSFPQPAADAAAPARPRSDWGTLRRLFPYSGSTSGACSPRWPS